MKDRMDGGAKHKAAGLVAWVGAMIDHGPYGPKISSTKKSVPKLVWGNKNKKAKDAIKDICRGIKIIGRSSRFRFTLTAIWARFGPIRLFLALLFKPRAIRLTQEQAEYVESLYLSNPDPAAIGRAFNQLYGADRFRYFMVPNAEGTALVFEPRDLWLDGLEYIRAAMIRLGAIIVRTEHGRKYDYYQTSHRMVQHTAGIAAKAPIPESKQKGA